VTPSPLIQVTGLVPAVRRSALNDKRPRPWRSLSSTGLSLTSLAPVPHHPSRLDVARVGRRAVDRPHDERATLAALHEREVGDAVVDADDVAGADSARGDAWPRRPVGPSGQASAFDRAGRHLPGEFWHRRTPGAYRFAYPGRLQHPAPVLKRRSPASSPSTACPRPVAERVRALVGRGEWLSPDRRSRADR
jgi:hypothetical protein